MKKIRNGLKWIFRNFFFIVIATYIITSIRAFWLLPNTEALPSAIIWTLINLLIALAVKAAKSRAYLRVFSLAILVIFLPLNIWLIRDMLYIKVVDTAKYDGTTYYLVEHLDYSEPYSWRDYSITKWHGLSEYKSYGVGERRVEMMYDEKMKVVYVVNTEWDKLVFLDSTPPRFFDEDNETEFNGKIYALASKCHPNPLKYNLCETFTYMVYQCELNYTECVSLQFQYYGEYIYEMVIENVNTSNEINIYFGIGEYRNYKKTLIFTQADMPRCHVEGCEILQP